MPNRTGFSGCCGINILYGFGNYGAGDSTSGSRGAITKYLRDQDAYHKKNKGGAASIMVASLNQHQREMLHEIFMKEGWSVIMDKCYHASHRSEITVYGKALYKEGGSDVPSKTSIAGVFGDLDFGEDELAEDL